MSRIGKLPVVVPTDVTVSVDSHSVTLKGSKGSLSLRLPPAVKLEQAEGNLQVVQKNNSVQAKEQYGLARSLLANAVKGVTDGFEKHLEIHGVGYRAQVSGNTVTLNIGFSHPIEYQLPGGVEAKVEANIITLSGIDKQVVGQAAAQLRALRKPEPYKGKGIRHQDEHVRRKAGKTASK